MGGDRRDQERNHFASDFNIESLEIRFINLASRWNGGNFNGIFSGVEYGNLIKTSSKFSASVQRLQSLAFSDVLGGTLGKARGEDCREHLGGGRVIPVFILGLSKAESYNFKSLSSQVKRGLGEIAIAVVDLPLFMFASELSIVRKSILYMSYFYFFFFSWPSSSSAATAAVPVVVP